MQRIFMICLAVSMFSACAGYYHGYRPHSYMGIGPVGVVVVDHDRGRIVSEIRHNDRRIQQLERRLEEMYEDRSTASDRRAARINDEIRAMEHELRSLQNRNRYLNDLL